MTKNKHSIGKKIRGIFLFFMTCVVLGLGFGMIMVHKLPDDMSTFALFWNDVLGVLLIFLSVFVQIIWHELGHMIAGLMRGWKFLSFMIFSWVISVKEGKLHISRFKIVGAGGQCLMMPPENGDTDFGIAFYNAGGILMNLITALMAVGLMVFCWDSLGFISTVLLYGLALSGFIFGLINAIPKISSDLANDGQNILTLRKDPFSTTVFLHSMRVLGELFQGKSFDELNLAYLCDKQEIDYRNSIHVMACAFDLSLAIARFDFEEAHRIAARLDAHKFECVKIYQMEIGMEEIYLNVVAPVSGVSVRRYRTDEMETYLKQQMAGNRPTAFRVKYALAHVVDQNEEEAEKYYQQFLRACDRFHVIGEVKMEKRLVEYVRQMRPEGSGKINN